MWLLRNKNFVFYLLFAVSLTGCLGKGELSDRVLQEANAMGEALIKKDYNTYAKYAIDWVYLYVGGIEAYKAGVKKIIDNYESRGKRFSEVHYELITNVESKDGKYQCMLSQTTTISGEYADTQDEAIIYAVSDDAENWRFAAITYMSQAQLKKLSPYLHPELKNPNWEK
jgi:hypothetical protein